MIAGLVRFPILVSALGAASCAIAGPCHMVDASSALTFSPPRLSASGAPVNAGVVPLGFVTPTKGNAVPGIGVSKYQTEVDFLAARRCGANFAIVRISAGWLSANEQTYKEHWRNAKSVGLFVAPYHNLVLYPPDARAALAAPVSERVSKIDALVARASHDNDQSNLFIETLKELLLADPLEKVGDFEGRLFLDPILDLSYDPLLSAPVDDRRAFAPVVKAAACHFIARVKSDPALGVKRVVIFTTPAVWRGYDLEHSSCGLGADGIALSVMTPDGDTAVLSDNYKDICNKGSENRCQFEHYSAFAPFINFNHSSGGTLLRYYGSAKQLEGRLNATK